MGPAGRGRQVSARRTRSPPLAIDRDWRLAGNNAVRTMTAVSLVNAFWYMSEWSSGGAAVTFANLVSVLLATRDSPARDALNFLKGAALANLIGTAAHYAVLTSTGDFLLLAAVVLPISMLAAAGRADKRAVSAGGFGISVFSALDPLNVMDCDFASALNGVLANLLGVATAVLALAALPPPGAQPSCCPTPAGGAPPCSNGPPCSHPRARPPSRRRIRSCWRPAPAGAAPAGRRAGPPSRPCDHRRRAGPFRQARKAANVQQPRLATAAA